MLEQKLTSAYAIERLREELKTERPIAMMSPAQNQHSSRTGKKANASMIWRLNEQIKMPQSHRRTLVKPTEEGSEQKLQIPKKTVLLNAQSVLSVSGRSNYSSYTGQLAKHCNIRYLKDPAGAVERALAGP